MELEQPCTKKTPQQLPLVGWEGLENPQPKPQPLDETRDCHAGETKEQRTKRLQAEWKERNKERVKMLVSRWHKEHREIVNERNRKWRKRNRLTLSILAQEKYARKKAAGIIVSQRKPLIGHIEGETREQRSRRKKREWAVRNHEKLAALARARRANNIEHSREIRRKANRKYRAKIMCARKLIQAGAVAHVEARYVDIIERTSARNRANRSRWRAANKAENKKQMHAYRRANPELFRALSLARAQRMKDDSCKPNKRMIEQIHRTAARIARCTGIKHHVDHIVPLARGGLHHESNLQILPAVINLRKGARMVA